MSDYDLVDKQWVGTELTEILKHTYMALVRLIGPEEAGTIWGNIGYAALIKSGWNQEK